MPEVGSMLSEQSGPRIACPRIDYAGEWSWQNTDAILESLPEVLLRQSWRDQPNSSFAQGSVRLGWRSDAICVLADLHDEDIFNSAVKLNEMTFLTGDALEMFFRFAGASFYTELHVTPENQHLQLRFPDEDQGDRSDISRYFLTSPDAFRSRVSIEKEKSLWRVAAEIPVSTCADRDAFNCGDQIAFSFSRYDYTSGDSLPVLTSSSLHRELNFHRENEWGVMTLVEA